MALVHFYLQVFAAIKEKGLISVESEDNIFLNLIFHLSWDSLRVDGEEEGNVNGCFQIIMRHSSKVFNFDPEIGRAVVDNFLFIFAYQNMVCEVAAVILRVRNVKLGGFQHIRHVFKKLNECNLY